MSPREKTGKLIVELREQQGLTQEQLADMTGLKKQNIYRIEKGLYSTGIEILAKIASALKMDIDFVNRK